MSLIIARQNRNSACCPYCGSTIKKSIEENLKVEGSIDLIKRYRCSRCKERFNRKTGTAMGKLKTPVNTVAKTLKGVANGLGIRPAARVFDVKPETVQRWLFRAGVQGQNIMEYYFKNLIPGMVQLDEICSFVFKKRVSVDNENKRDKPKYTWIWIALIVKSRLIVAHHVGNRSKDDAITFLTKVFKRINLDQVFWTSDQLAQYASAILQCYENFNINPYENPQKNIYGRVVKLRQKGKIIKVESEVYWGDEKEINELLKKFKQTKINTAYIERVNLTLRQETSKLERKTLKFAKTWYGLELHLSFFIAYYNFCRFHMSLEKELVPLPTNSLKKRLSRTPAMVQGITDHCWSLEEFLLFQIPENKQLIPLTSTYKVENIIQNTKRILLPDIPKLENFTDKNLNLIQNNKVLSITNLSPPLDPPSVVSDRDLFSEMIFLSPPYPLLDIEYVNGNGVSSQRIIRPIKVEFRYNQCYIEAYCYLREEQRIFRLDRIQSIKIVSSTDIPSISPKKKGINKNQIKDQPKPVNKDKKVEITPSKTTVSKNKFTRKRTKKMAKPEESVTKFAGGNPDTFLSGLEDHIALLIWQFLLWMYPNAQMRQHICEGTGIARSTVYDALARLVRYGLVEPVEQKGIGRGRPKTLWQLVDNTLESLEDENFLEPLEEDDPP